MTYLALLSRLVGKPAPIPAAPPVPPVPPVAQLTVYRGETILSQGIGR